MMNEKKEIKVAIIDDSDETRTIIEEGFSNNETIKIIAVASDISKGRNLILNNEPNVLIFNIENLQFKAISFLRKLLSEFSLPVIVISSSTQKNKLLVLQALESGAIDFILTPVSDVHRNKDEIINLLIQKIKIVSKANISLWQSRNINATNDDNIDINLLKTSNKIIAIGASTGGMEAVNGIITRLPSSMPGIVVAIPMTFGFTKTYADRLNELSNLQVKEAEHEDKIINGKVLIAPGDAHIKIIRSGGRYKVLIENGEKFNNHRPSIDILMTSLAEQASSNAIGVLLTGEGLDGALGLKSIKDNDGTTIVQDKKTSIIYEMPKSAVELKVFDYQLSINDIPQKLIELA